MPRPARAATVTLSTETFDAQGGDQVLVYTLDADAAPGEANDIAFAVTAGSVTRSRAAASAPSSTSRSPPTPAPRMVDLRAWSTCACTYVGTLSVRRGGRLLARGPARIRPGSPEHPRRIVLRAPLTAAGVRAPRDRDGQLQEPDQRRAGLPRPARRLSSLAGGGAGWRVRACSRP